MDPAHFKITVPPHFVFFMWLYLAAISACVLALGNYGMWWSYYANNEMFTVYYEGTPLENYNDAVAYYTKGYHIFNIM